MNMPCIMLTPFSCCRARSLLKNAPKQRARRKILWPFPLNYPRHCLLVLL
jgi:hypothetical protein